MSNRLTISLIFVLALTSIQCSNKPKSNTNDEEVIPATDAAVSVVEDAGQTQKNGSKKSTGQTAVSVPTSSQKSEVGDKTGYSALSQHIKSQDDESILKEGSALLMKNPNDVKAINAMAMVYYKRAQYPLAKSLLLRALKTNASAFEVHSNLGIVQLALGEKNEALKSFKKSIELNLNDYVSAGNAGSLYVVEQDFEKAAVVLEIAYSKGNRNSKVLSNFAVALTATGKYEKADKIYREALKENANNREVLYNHAILLIQFLKKKEEGLEIVKKLKFLGVPEEGRKKIQELQTLAEKK